MKDFLIVMDRDVRDRKERFARDAEVTALAEVETLDLSIEREDAADRRTIADGIVSANRISQLVSDMRATVKSQEAFARCMERRERAETAATKARARVPEFPTLPAIPADALTFIRAVNSGGPNAPRLKLK